MGQNPIPPARAAHHHGDPVVRGIEGIAPRPRKGDTARAMSQENVELVRWTFTSDPTRLFSLFDEKIELDARAYAELPGTVVAGRGREVVERFCREYWGTWSEYSVEPLEFIDAGDDVVVVVRERGKGKGSGVPFERTNIQVWTLRDGRLVRWRMFADRAEGLEAVGLSE